MSDITLQEYLDRMAGRVETGLKFLDEFYGTDEWVLTMDLGNLDLADPDRCVLGQLGKYTTLLQQCREAIGWDGSSAFYASPIGVREVSTKVDDVYVNIYTLEYAILTAMWRTVLIDRLTKLWQETPKNDHERLKSIGARQQEVLEVFADARAA